MSIDRRYVKEFLKVLDCLSKANALDCVIVIGSWAEYLYWQTGYLSDFYPSIQTHDADFLIPDIHKPTQKTFLVSILKESGFTYNEDRIDNVSQIFGDGGFEVEFLTPQIGDGQKPLGIANIGVKPQQLTHLRMLVDFSTLVDYEGYTLRVPEPEAYVAHKMIINTRRGLLKRNRDQEKIGYLIPFLDLNRFKDVFYSLSKKERKLIIEYDKHILNNKLDFTWGTDSIESIKDTNNAPSELDDDIEL